MSNNENFKFVMVGHVDHGKSTLIGRLLFDTNSLPEGKIEEIKAICESLGKELEFGYIPSRLLDANLYQGIIKDILINQAKFTEQSIRCPYKVDKLEWQQTLWRFYWLWQIAIADMENIWNIMKDPSSFLSIEERNDYLRDITKG